MASCTSTAGPPTAIPLRMITSQRPEAAEVRSREARREVVVGMASHNDTPKEVHSHRVAHGMGPVGPVSRHERPNPSPPTTPRGRRIGGTVDLHQWANCTSTNGPHAAATLDAVLTFPASAVESRIGDVGRKGDEEMKRQATNAHDSIVHHVTHGMGPTRPARYHRRPIPNLPTVPRGRHVGRSVYLHPRATCTSSDGPHAAATLDAVRFNENEARRHCGGGNLQGGDHSGRRVELVEHKLTRSSLLSWGVPWLWPQCLWPPRWRRPQHCACSPLHHMRLRPLCHHQWAGAELLHRRRWEGRKEHHEEDQQS